MKTEPLPGVTANVTVYDTEIKDFQAQVVNAGVGVLRGYLANAEKVRVRGVEFDGSARVNDHLSFYGAAAYTDGKYVSFPDAPPPLEDTGGPQVKDISGSDLPGISKWAVSLGGEYVNPGDAPRPDRGVLRCARRQLSLLVLFERERLAVSGGRRLFPAQRPGRLPVGGWLDCLRLVPQPAEQGLFRLALGGARQHRSLCGAARRSQNLWRDPADDVQVTVDKKEPGALRHRALRRSTFYVLRSSRRPVVATESTRGSSDIANVSGPPSRRAAALPSR